MSEPTWQPIATAPKDGTRILLFCDRIFPHKIKTGHWFSFERQTDGATSFRYDGWWMDGFDHPFNQPPFCPTHWTPLPSPPPPQPEDK